MAKAGKPRKAVLSRSRRDARQTEGPSSPVPAPLHGAKARGEAGVYGGRAGEKKGPRDAPTRPPRSFRERKGDGGDDIFADPRTGEALAVSQSRNVRSRCRCSVCPAIHIS